MSDPNDDQAAKLIEALAPKLAETLLPALQKQVEDQIGGVLKKNDELLDKLSKQKSSDDQLESTKALLAALDGKQKQELADKNGLMQFDREGQDIRISKADARDPRKYREAKKLAGERGVDLVIDRDVS